MSQPLKSKTRNELAEEYGVTPRTFRRWLKEHGILLPRGKIMPKDLRRIYEVLGKPEK